MEQKEFRAWNPIEQEWEYYTFNDLCYNTNRPDICLERWSQWTGLVDCNGNKIFEGHYLKYLNGDSARGGYKEVAGGIYEVFWDRYKWRLRRLDNDRFVRTVNFGLVDNRFKEFEIIGNRFQNPELTNKEE